MDDTGDTTYFGDSTGTPFDAGVTNSTGPSTTAPPDASGGSGSYLPAFLGVATNGLNAILAANLNDKFGQGIASGLATVDANGNLQYKATPAQQPSASAVVTSQALNSPVLIFGVVAVIVLFLVLKK
jgi:hypothetical protein